MRFKLDKNQVLNSFKFQVLIVILAFAILASIMIIYASHEEKDRLYNNVRNTLNNSENKIISLMQEMELVFNYFSETTTRIIMNGQSLESFTANISTINNFILSNDNLSEFKISYGYIDKWNMIFQSDNDFLSYFIDQTVPKSDIVINFDNPSTFSKIKFNNILFPNGQVLQKQPWYEEAIAANGKIVITGPNANASIDPPVITISRCIKDNYGNFLGVLCFDINYNSFYDEVANIQLTQNSYGLLINNDLKLIEYPSNYSIGENIHAAEDDIAVLAEEARNGNVVFGKKAKSFKSDNSYVFFCKIKYDWYLGIVIPVNEFNASIVSITLYTILLCVILASVLCYFMYHIFLAKKRSDLRIQQKSNFLATMSHEIRTPLNAMLGMTEIQMQNTLHPTDTSEAFMKINYSGNLLLGIINDILDLSKIESGKLDLSPVKYDVASLLNDVIQLNYVRYEGKPIEFVVTIDENIPSFLVGDELRIKQVLNNLISNAFKFTDGGKVLFSANAICLGRGGHILVTLVFNISDTGSGMPQSQINKIFDDYSHINQEANRTTEGPRLGMTITRNLLELMQGTINFKSIIGEGTTVNVRIPQKTEGLGISGIIGKEMAQNLMQISSGNTMIRKRPIINHEYMPYGSVLIVDDVETNLYVAKGLMIPYGLKIDVAGSGFEAIEKVKDGAVYDIIFMDHMMPRMDGIETTKKLRSMNYTNPIIALTANALTGQAEMFIKNGFNDFISKPIDIRQLNIALNKMIRDKQISEVIEAARAEKDKLVKEKEPKTVQIDKTLAAIFIKDAEKTIKILENIIQKKGLTESDMQLYVINVHAMKSALANIGELNLSEKAGKLEQSGRNRDVNVISNETSAFITELRAIIEKIRPKEENESIEDTEDSLIYLREKLFVIKDACSAFDKKTVKNSLNEIKEKAWSREKRELLDEISEHLLHSEFEKISELINKNIEDLLPSLF